MDMDGYGGARGARGEGEERGRRRKEGFSREEGPQQLITGSLLWSFDPFFLVLVLVFVLRWAVTKELARWCVLWVEGKCGICLKVASGAHPARNSIREPRSVQTI